MHQSQIYISYILKITISVIKFIHVFWLGFMLHQDCKGYMATSSFTGGGPPAPLRAFQA